MRTLRFTVDGQTIRKNPDCDFSGLVAGSVGYLRANFKFSKEWFGCTKAASFWFDGLEHAVLHKHVSRGRKQKAAGAVVLDCAVPYDCGCVAGDVLHRESGWCLNGRRIEFGFNNI